MHEIAAEAIAEQMRINAEVKAQHAREAKVYSGGPRKGTCAWVRLQPGAATGFNPRLPRPRKNRTVDGDGDGDGDVNSETNGDVDVDDVTNGMGGPSGMEEFEVMDAMDAIDHMDAMGVLDDGTSPGAMQMQMPQLMPMFPSESNYISPYA